MAEKTGYPEDMLDLDLDLEADLGVDTVKQAEMFAAVRAAYNIPRDENLKLRDFPTLAHVIKFAHDRSALATAVPVPSVKAELSGTEASASCAGFDPACASCARQPRCRESHSTARARASLASSAHFLQSNRRETRPQQPRRTYARQGRRGTGTDETSPVRLGVEVLRIDGTPPPTTLTALLKTWTAAGPIQGVYWLPALDNEGDLRQLDSAAWHERPAGAGEIAVHHHARLV